MRLTKLVHSCVLAEDNGKAVLFDPGYFSWSSGLVKIDQFPKLDAVVITHQHSDHCSQEFVKALITFQPDVPFIVPPDTHQQLKTWGVQNISSDSTADLQVTVGDHAPVVPFGDQVQNLQVQWLNKLTMPGDSHDIKQTKDVLLIPIQAPWGTTIKAMQLIQELKPKFVLPIHDWMWNEQWRNLTYDRTAELCKEIGATFIHPVDGEAQEISI